jgi:hypothetical protein
MHGVATLGAAVPAPDRSFVGRCRFCLQAPAPGAVGLAGVARDEEAWSMAWNVGADTSGPQETMEEGLARAELRLRALAATGIRRVALYGAGEHSRLLMAQTAGGPTCVVAVIEDAPGEVYFNGVPLLTPAEWPNVDADALVVSSRDHEASLAVRARAWLPRYVPIICFYDGESRR